MRLSNVIHLYRIRLRARLVQELLALAGISVGVALVFAALVANTSLTGSMRHLTEAIVGDATLEVASRGSQGFDQRSLAEVRAIDGVAAAAPILSTRVNLVGPSGRRSLVLIGGDASFSHLGGSLLPKFTHPGVAAQRALALSDPIADDIGVGLGQRVAVELEARTVGLPLAAKLGRDEIGALVDSPVALAPLHVVQEVSGRTGQVSRVFVRAEPGREGAVERRLRDVVDGRLDVRPASSEVSVFEQAVYPTNQSTALFSVLSALVGFLFALSAMLLTVPQRRRLVADLRMAGYEPWVLIQLMLFDALVLGSAGSVVGLGIGDQMSRHLFDETPGYLSTAFPVGSQRVVTWASIAIAGAAGLLAACVAVLVPLRDVLRTPSRGERDGARARARAGEHGAVVAGLGCLIATTVVVAAWPEAAMVGLVTLTASLLLLLPMLLRLVTAGYERVGRLFRSPVPVLAALELRSRDARTRTLALAATGAVAVFATVAIGGANADLKRGLDASAVDIDSNADVWVTFAGDANTLATTSFPTPNPETAHLESVEGVSAVRPYRGGFLDVGNQRAWVLAPPRSVDDPVPPSQIVAGDPDVANERLREGGWLALSEAIAEKEGVDVGDRYRLSSPVPTTFRVAALLTNLGWPPGAIVMSSADHARAWGSSEISALQIETGGPPAEVGRRIERALGALPLRVETRQARIDRHYGTARDGLERLTQISVLVVISAILAMAAAMGGMIWQRRPTIASLKVHGYPESELWKALLLESGLLLGTGCLAGAVFGLYGQVLMSRALETITGFPVFYSTALASAVAILGLVTVVALAMLALPGWLAVRVRPAPGVPT